MITSMSKELCAVQIPKYDGEIKMLPFYLDDLSALPDMFIELVKQMISFLPSLSGVAYLTIDGRTIHSGQTHRRGGKHIDGNYLPECNSWGNGGGNGWKVGEGGHILSSAEHKISYETSTGGMLIASTYPACKGWNGKFEGSPYVGGDCSQLNILNDGFLLKPNTLYYGNSQFIHESLPLAETVHRTIVRITLPLDYPVID